jgi:hypothetical protein
VWWLRELIAAQLVEGAVEETLAYYALWNMPEVILTLLVRGGALGMYLSILDKYCFVHFADIIVKRDRLVTLRPSTLGHRSQRL